MKHKWVLLQSAGQLYPGSQPIWHCSKCRKESVNPGHGECP